MQNFRALVTPPPDPRAYGDGGFSLTPLASGFWGLRPQTPNSIRRLRALLTDPQNSPPLRISGYAPDVDTIITLINIATLGLFCIKTWIIALCSKVLQYYSLFERSIFKLN